MLLVSTGCHRVQGKRFLVEERGKREIGESEEIGTIGLR